MVPWKTTKRQGQLIKVSQGFFQALAVDIERYRTMFSGPTSITLAAAEEVEADKVLVASGKIPNMKAQLGWEFGGLRKDKEWNLFFAGSATHYCV
jgi:pyruvate/2-oxoglutarate dehydrogenase complex dihydrolipoamide dehydrogenase (E3) component